MMRRAIRRSRRGYPAPNPHVGCVIAQGETIVGEGHIDYAWAGGPHAEIEALRRAGDRAKGSTVYVTLEPCNHHGRTGPCSEALIAAGVRRVVIACADPNPKAAGGAEGLRAAGIEVELGVLEAEAAAENVPFLFAMKHRRPYVVAKAAMSLDGRIALPNGESQWITGESARREGHRLRAWCGAVLVGRRTAELDRPSLTARIPGVRNQPLRLILDADGKLPADLPTFDDGAPVWHVTRKDIPVTEIGFDLEALLKGLFERGHVGLLIEGGGQTIASFARAGLIDRYELFMGPMVLGQGPGWMDASLSEHLRDVPRVRIDRVRRLGMDWQITAYPQR